VDGVTVRISVPVSLHEEAGAQARGNLIGQMAVPLPIGIADPVARLQAISRDTAERKMRIPPSLGRIPTRDRRPRALSVGEASTGQRGQHGHCRPGGAVVLGGGAAVRGVPDGPTARNRDACCWGNVPRGSVNAMVVADAQGYPDIDIFTRCAQEELRTLAEVARPLRTALPHSCHLTERAPTWPAC
jgi:diacylglycerol O-acyltransferase